MHKPTKAKWRAFKCRNNVHRFGRFMSNITGLKFTKCKDCNYYPDNHYDDIPF